jgi:hypothetical protein
MATKSTPVVESKEAATKMSRVKLGFLYVLIGGLVVSALISVVAILIGNFNSVVVKALSTTLVLVIHSVLLLTIISADRDNRIGKAIVPTTILGAIIANIITSTLGIWGVWEADLSWRSFMVYILLIGSAFLVAGSLRLIIAHQATKVLVYVTVGLVLAMTLLLLPWIMLDTTSFGDLYFRLVGALAILTFTALIILFIIRRIALSANSSLKTSIPAAPVTPNGMMAILVTVGTFVAIVWFYGMVIFIAQAASLHVDSSHQPGINTDDSSYPRDRGYRYY